MHAFPVGKWCKYMNIARSHVYQMIKFFGKITVVSCAFLNASAA